MTTPDGACEVNAVSRILDLCGRLPEPDELDPRGGPAGLLAPRALHRYREQLEPPRLEEGFVALDLVPWVERAPEGSARPTAMLLDAAHLDGPVEVLRQAREEGRRLWCIGWAPGADGGEEDRIRARAASMGLPLEGVALCRHAAGPPRCWCRKPLPGLVVLLARQQAVGLSDIRIAASSAADRTLAAKLGIRVVSP
jgi:hypothetical protein